MMLKEKSSPWARLKYLYVLPVAAVAMTAFARPEVSNKVEEISSVKVNDLAAIVETKVADTAKPAKVKYVPIEVKEPSESIPVWDVVEEMPKFPGGGMPALMQYFKENLHYPEAARKNGTQGRVTVQFVVDKEGSIKEPKVLRPVNEEFDAEALRLISSMPRWKPGRQKGEPVAVRYTVPVVFRLDDDKLGKTSSANAFTVEGYAGNGKEPLYIVDGKEVTSSVVSALNPEKIEGVTVLKDETATATYGEKGKNGVVLITLKKGDAVEKPKKKMLISGRAYTDGKKNDWSEMDVFVDGVKIDPDGKRLEEIVRGDIESIVVDKSSGTKGAAIRITTKKSVGGVAVDAGMKVKGQVIDEKGNPVVGAIVLVEGTKAGSVTDTGGHFALSLLSKDAVLVVSYVGMATTKVKAQPELTVTLKSE